MTINGKHNRIDEIIEWTTYGMIEGDMSFTSALLSALDYLEIPHQGERTFVNVEVMRACEDIVKKWGKLND